MVVLGLALAVLVVTLGLLALGGAVAASHRARIAADLGALAAASSAESGGASPCGRADAVVRANGARLTGCRVVRSQADVTVQTFVPGWGGAAVARARAGPVDP